MVSAPLTEADKACFHCGQPVPPQTHWITPVAGVEQSFCCQGCQAVAQAIVEAGLADFYQYRDQPSPTAAAIVPAQLRQWQVYDHPAVQKKFVYQAGTPELPVAQVALILEGITCAACVWLNEKHLMQLPGVLEVRINYTTHRAHIQWNPAQLQLSAILDAIERLGYHAHPYDPHSQQKHFEETRKQYLLRMAVSGFLGMQVMMISVALYEGAWSGIEARFLSLFHWMNLILTLPVLFYAAAPFFKTAWRDLQQYRMSMEVPIALGLVLAFIGSVWATLTGVGEVYYDSVVMFVFFLLTGRYFELMARQRGSETLERLARSTPAVANQWVMTEHGEAQEQQVLVAELVPGDQVLIRPGEAVPVDGIVIEGQSSVSEALLTGESIPVLKKTGDRLVGGSINRESPLRARVTQVGEQTILAGILRLLNRAQTEKPAIMQLADRIAGYWVLLIVGLAGCVAVYWWWVEPVRWLPVTFAVLAVTCPCALSLATPAALSATTATMSSLGVIITKGQVLETLAQVTDVIFDKTGTLTQGRLSIAQSYCWGAQSIAEYIAIAQALEAQSEHPIAQAFRDYTGVVGRSRTATAVQNEPGAGLAGWIEGQYYCLGTLAFIQAQLPQINDIKVPVGGGEDYAVYLADGQQLLAGFCLSDPLREDAQATIQQLQAAGVTVHLLSGDHAPAVAALAQAVGIAHYASRLSPADKLLLLQRLQQQGAIVMMVGDGVNDAPVLAAAQVSVALNSGADLAKLSADMVLLGRHLQPLYQSFLLAKRCQRIIRQNLAWAAGYNLAAVPAAAVGWVPPWLATIGMSFSSLGVVLNALRLTRFS